MNRDSQKQDPKRVNFQPPAQHDSWNPNLRGLRQSEREAYHLILELTEQEHMSNADKLNFLGAVKTLCGAVHVQANGNMDDFYPKAILAKKIETLILEEPTEILNNCTLQEALLCTVALRQVNPPFHLSEILDLANAGISRMFCLPFVFSPDQKESASLYLQATQALDEMLRALVLDDMDPNMHILQKFLEIILPWLTLSDKVHEQTRALGTTARLLRFICNFPTLSNMESFSMSGKLMGTFGLFCMDSNPEISLGAAEALHYLFKILVLQRSVRSKMERMLRDLQKHFHREWVTSLQDLSLFFRKFLTPMERADVIMVTMEGMTSSSKHDVYAASRLLKTILKFSIPEIEKVPEIIRYIYFHMSSFTAAISQNTMKKFFYLLSQTYTDEVILTLFKIEDYSQTETHKPWAMLASFPRGYDVIMKRLLQRLAPQQVPEERQPSRTVICPLIATRAIHKLLLEPSQRMEIQSFFSPLFMALLFQTSFLMAGGNVEVSQDQHHIAEWVDPVSSTIDTMKTLLHSSGYGEYVSEIQKLEGWELLASAERHYDGVTLLARCLVMENCWHNCPTFSILIKTLQDHDSPNHFTALVFLTELLQCPDVAAIMDDIATNILASWFMCEDPATVKLLLRMTEVFTKHKNLVRRFHILQPQVLNCCYSSNPDVVTETFRVLQHLLEDLTWQHSAPFLIQLSFTVAPFFEEESDHLRLMAFQIYGSLLVKVKRRFLVFPLRHQILNLIVPLGLHLKDENFDVAQICRVTLCNTAAILGWSNLKEVFSKEDIFTILRALLQQESNKALWFLKQSVDFFKSSQIPIRQVAVWFTGQILQSLDLEDMNETEEAYTELEPMQQPEWLLELFPGEHQLLPWATQGLPELLVVCPAHFSTIPLRRTFHTLFLFFHLASLCRLPDMVASALRHMKKDPDSMVSCLATQTIYVLEAREKMLQARPPTVCFWRRRSQRGRF